MLKYILLFVLLLGNMIGRSQEMTDQLVIFVNSESSKLTATDQVDLEKLAQKATIDFNL